MSFRTPRNYGFRKPGRQNHLPLHAAFNPLHSQHGADRRGSYLPEQACRASESHTEPPRNVSGFYVELTRSRGMRCSGLLLCFIRTRHTEALRYPQFTACLDGLVFFPERGIDRAQ